MVAFSIIGAVTGLAAAVGPIIGGFVTTYLSWRYVFAAESIIMVIVLIICNKINDEAAKDNVRLDPLSVFLSAFGMGALVFGVLQSKTWGWIQPTTLPTVNGKLIAPLGISLVVYLILIGIGTLYIFLQRQKKLEKSNNQPLLKVSMLNIPVLRSGLSVLLSQYFIIASLFFVVPVYLQIILGYDALQTGIKLIPLSIGLVIFSAIGSKMSANRSPKLIARLGQIAMAVGALIIMGSIEPALRGPLFWVGMFIIGVGFGLLASQIGNVNMSAVEKDDTSEVGGLQGTFQNLGTSFGTALVGSVFILVLSNGFVSSIQNNSNLSQSSKDQITSSATAGVPIVSPAQAEQYVISKGGDQATATEVSSSYQSSQIKALKESMLFVFIAAFLALLMSKNLPSTLPKPQKL